MGTLEWGPSAWKFLHTATFAYGSNDGTITAAEKIAARSLFESLKHLLPCKNCCSHYCSALVERPLTDQILDSRESLSRWFVEIHNDVNVRLGKPVMPYEEAVKIYTQFVGCDPNSTEASECSVTGTSTSTSTIASTSTGTSTIAIATTSAAPVRGMSPWISGSIGGAIGILVGVLGVVLFIYIRGLKRVKVTASTAL